MQNLSIMVLGYIVVSHDFANLEGPDQNIKAEENIEKYHKTKEVIEGM